VVYNALIEIIKKQSQLSMVYNALIKLIKKQSIWVLCYALAYWAYSQVTKKMKYC